jgi:hypothetical protein
LNTAVLLAGAVACKRPLSGGALGTLRLALLGCCGSLFYFQVGAQGDSFAPRPVR